MAALQAKAVNVSSIHLVRRLLRCTRGWRGIEGWRWQRERPKEMPATRTALSAASCGPMSRPSAAPPQRANAPVPKSASARYSPGEGAIRSGCSRLWQQRWEILFQFIKDFGTNDLGNVLLSLYQNSKGGMKCAGIVRKGVDRGKDCGQRTVKHHVNRIQSNHLAGQG